MSNRNGGRGYLRQQQLQIYSMNSKKGRNSNKVINRTKIRIGKVKIMELFEFFINYGYDMT